MRRGTTQVLIFTVPAEIEIDKLYITFCQRGKIVLEKSETDCEISGGRITLHLTQEDTLKLAAPMAVYIQLRIRDKAGNALASDLIHTSAEVIFKDGVI